MAAEAGQLTAVKLLIKKGADHTRVTDSGQSALHLACYHNNMNTVEYLVKTVDLDPNFLLKGGTKSNCLHLAVQQKHHRIVKFMIESSTVNLRQLTWNADDLVALAIKNNDYKLVFYLLYQTVQNKYRK